MILKLINEIYYHFEAFEKVREILTPPHGKTMKPILAPKYNVTRCI